MTPAPRSDVSSARPGTAALIRAAAAGLLVALAASCASMVRGQPAGVFDEHGTHLVTHAPGRCAICDLYGSARESVVAVTSASGLGAGVIVSRDGLVVTNAHVMGVAVDGNVETHDGKSYAGRVSASDPAEDLAVLRVDAPGRTWRPVSVDGGPLPAVGSDVYIIGHPLGLGWTVTRGIVSGIRSEAGRTMIQTDAPISPGNSGGAMLDAAGHLVGIVTSKVVGNNAGNLAFARPASAVLAVLARSGVAGNGRPGQAADRLEPGADRPPP
jgi:S1-C subfamily serine protease